VDPNTNNLVAAGTFFSTSKQVVCMARVESNPQVSITKVHCDFSALVLLYITTYLTVKICIA
jgi:hypothetical protein